MRIVNTDGATMLNHDGIDYEADAGGVFDVPLDVYQSLIGFPHWIHEYEAVDLANAAKAAEDVDPSVQARRLAEQSQQILDLTGQLQALAGSGDQALREENEALKAKLAAAEAALAAAASATTFAQAKRALAAVS